jgi:aspartate carbamoyltransferase catalytic subunit
MRPSQKPSTKAAKNAVKRAVKRTVKSAASVGEARDVHDAVDAAARIQAKVATAAPRHLLQLEGMNRVTLTQILRRAVMHAARSEDGQGAEQTLSGVTVANLFFEDSTRTRTSFSMAAFNLGARVLEFGATTSSVSKGETLIDTARNIEAMGVGVLVVRARQSGAAELISKNASASIVNAGDGRHEHPTQGLLDMLTVAQALGRVETLDFSDLRLAIVGDAVSSRVARSAIHGFTTLGARVICIGPAAMAPKSMEVLGCTVERNLDAVLPDVDAVMMLRVQFERHGDAASGAKASPLISSVREYRAGYALTPERESIMKPAAIVMHPGPMNRGLEIDAAVADGDRSVILQQARNGVFARMAALEWVAAAPQIAK